MFGVLLKPFAGTTQRVEADKSSKVIHTRLLTVQTCFVHPEFSVVVRGGCSLGFFW